MTGTGDVAGRRSERRSAIVVLGGIGLFLLWSTLAQIFLFLPPLAGGAWVLAVGTFFLWYYAGRHSGDQPARLERMRLRPLGTGGTWVLKALPASVAVGLGLSGFVALSGAVASVPALIRDYVAEPGGWVAFAIFAVAVQPLIEELFFRGWVQGTLERRLGVTAAIAITSVLFALGHLGSGSSHGLITPLVLGAIYGTAVHLTGSVWASVILHSAWNATILIGGAAAHLPMPKLVDAIPPETLSAGLLLSGSIALAAMVARRRSVEGTS